MKFSNRTANAPALVILLLAAAGVYAGSFDVPFYLDDFRHITENRHVRIESLTLAELYDAAFKSPLATRPAANVSLALNYYFHRDAVFGYHLTNVVIHGMTGFFLYLLFSLTLSSPPLRGRFRHERVISLAAALIWLTHPLHTGSVIYVVQRMVLLAVLFYVLALVCYIKGRVAGPGGKRLAWFAGALLSAVLAMGSKEIAATLPMVIFLYEWYFFQDLDARWLRRNIVFVAGFLLAVVLAYVLYTGSLKAILAGYEKRPFTLPQRLYTELRVVWFYIGLLLYPNPAKFNLDHSISLSGSLFSPATTALSAAGIILALAASFVTAKKQRIFSFAVLWYLGNLVIESSVLGLELIFEHRTYLPSIFVVFALTLWAAEHVRPQKIAVGLLAAVVVLFSFWTAERVRVWRDPVLFWSDSTAKAPQKARPHINLSVVLRERGRIDEAIAAAQQAIDIDPRFVNGFVASAKAYAARGDLRRAEAQYREALRRLPDYAEVYNELGVLYAAQGRMKEAVAAFDENLRMQPDNISALVNRASIMARQGRFARAIADFNSALKAGGQNPDILFNLALAYEQNGNIDQAIDAMEKVVRLNPQDRQAEASLKRLRMGSGR